MTNTLPVILAVLCFWLRSVTATPVFKYAVDPVNVNMLQSQGSADFVAGKPLTEEMKGDFSKIGKGMSFIPWDKQDPTLHEGDIKLVGDKNAILSNSYRWANAQIPYVISADYTPEQRSIIAFGMKAYHDNTCIRFVPRTCEKNYITIFKSGGGCYSYIGMINRGAQEVSLDDGCIASWAPGVVMHEFMHAAGFFHEHTRPDRDTYVTINSANVLSQYFASNFNIMSASQVTTLGLAYDYGSVMHYSKYAFAIDNTIPTITPIPDATVAIGNRAGFSSLDLQKLNALYCSSG
uniref:Metalloendopeptidase n=1 Tax=Daphnia galeata TaxID=27404 RepID=A0A8J2RXC1_9CRUS|nr:unnamed protein product [Daphnia galeata]